MDCPKLDARRQALYGITQDEWCLLWGDGHCPICSKPYSRTPNRRAVIDHDHETGGVRGVCCGADNYALGTRTIRWFLRAARYMEITPARLLGIKATHRDWRD